jgi:spoIIIJ-associated protein
MPKSIEAQGVTVDEAIQTALNLLGLGRDSVEIEIIHHPRSGFLGIGARRAKVRATMREQVMKDGEEFDMAPDGGSRGRRRRRSSSRRRAPRGGGEPKPRETKVGAAEPPGRRTAADARAAEAPAQRGGEGEAESGAAERVGPEQRGRGRGRRGGRGRGAAERRNQDESRQRPPAESVQRESTSAEPQGGGRSATRGSRTQVQTVAKRLEPEALRTRAEQLTSELLGHMGVGATVSARIEDGGSIAVTIEDGENGAVLIGRRGTTLDALEHIINRMTTGADLGARVRVTLDVCGYRERRKATLAEVAIRLKQHALSTMRRVQITPLSPHDRIVFQEALAGDDTVTTRILGSGFYRRVLVVPRGQENDGGVAEEFNEEGQMVGYPKPGGAAEDSLEESSEESPSDVDGAADPDSGEPIDDGAEDLGKPRGGDS